MNAGNILMEMANTYAERQRTYGDSYLKVGKIVKILWPDGVPNEVASGDSYNLFIIKLVKLVRFAHSNLTHIDSIHDDAVYSALIEAELRNGGR